jgi:hypothetical protein
MMKVIQCVVRTNFDIYYFCHYIIKAIFYFYFNKTENEV